MKLTATVNCRIFPGVPVKAFYEALDHRSIIIRELAGSWPGASSRLEDLTLSDGLVRLLT